MEADRKPPRLAPPAAEHQHGDERRAWSGAFLEYAYALVEEPAYAGMPAARDDRGKLDWTVPSNRSPGSKNWDGNARRKAWWEAKAREVDIPVEGKWISRVAKSIHPWGWKPCQTCGRWMRLSYSYPTPKTVAALNRWLPADEWLEVTDYLDIYEVAEHLVTVLGQTEAVGALASALPKLRGATPSSLEALQRELEERVVRAEPRGRLSPGAMSNAPDRLDGFHTYNLCCRAKQDIGRSLDNLKTYGVDRRAFEHWSEGDWEAANRLMSQTVEGTCPRCGAFGPLSADHIGPISLGFQHTPFFEAVCTSCNSAKNNRMSLRDVEMLRPLEADERVEIISWHAAALWNGAKGRVRDNAGALRLSKLLNVNQHEFLRLLLRARTAGIPDVLMQFLSPAYAEERVEFIGLDRTTLRYAEIVRGQRQETYSRSKAARLVRVAFEALDEYGKKEKRNVRTVPSDLLEAENRRVEQALGAALADASRWRAPLIEALDPGLPSSVKENRLQELIGPGSYEPAHDYGYVREAFESYMAKVGTILATRLDDDHAIKLWDEALGGQSP